MKTRLIAALIAAACAAPLAAQQPPPQPQRGAEPPQAPTADALSPPELQRMFDAYALMQAQEQLRISDDQYAQFLNRFKTLQDTRRKAVRERLRIIQNLRRLLAAPAVDDAQIKDQLKALDEVETRAAADVRKAHDAVDQVLTTTQQAKFRVFEENMERREAELVARARQANRKKEQL